jgi:hypothetical protein
MQDAAEVVVAAQGHLWVSDLRDNPTFPATTSPTSTLSSDWLDVGYITEDGPTFTVTPTVEDINAWQSATPIRRLVTSRVQSVAASLQQWNQNTFGLAFGGGTWSQPAANVFRYEPPADQDPLAEYGVILDLEDGDRHGRFVLFRANITDTVETTLTRTGAAVLPVTVNTLTPDDQDYSWEFVSDDEAAFALAS